VWLYMRTQAVGHISMPHCLCAHVQPHSIPPLISGIDLPHAITTHAPPTHPPTHPHPHSQRNIKLSEVLTMPLELFNDVFAGVGGSMTFSNSNIQPAIDQIKEATSTLAINLRPEVLPPPPFFSALSSFILFYF
jgi:hypothetical protein